MDIASLHLCTSDSWGGLELYACTLMDELQKAGNTVYAICKPKSPVENFLRAHRIRYTHFPSFAPVSVRSVRFLRMLLRQHPVQVVHVHFHRDIWCASLALRSDRERKLFLSIYMGVPKKNDLLHRYIYARVDGILTSSQELNKRLPHLYPVAPSKIHYLPYGRHIESYRRDGKKRAAIREQYGVRADDILVGTIVRIDPGKGVMDFAQSFRYIDERVRHRVKFMIVGEPTRKAKTHPGESPFEPKCEAYLREIESFIANNNTTGKIILTGYQDDLAGFLSAFDVFVFPSRDEMYSLVVLDAMCMSLPVVAANAGGNVYQVKDNVNGLLYDVSDSRDLARKIVTYAENPRLGQQHAAAAREFVRYEHSMDKTIATLREMYRGEKLIR